MAVLPSEDIETDAPVIPLPISLSPCWFQRSTPGVKIHAAPTPSLSPGPPTPAGKLVQAASCFPAVSLTTFEGEELQGNIKRKCCTATGSLAEDRFGSKREVRSTLWPLPLFLRKRKKMLRCRERPVRGHGGGRRADGNKPKANKDRRACFPPDGHARLLAKPFHRFGEQLWRERVSNLSWRTKPCSRRRPPRTRSRIPWPLRAGQGHSRSRCLPARGSTRVWAWVAL